MKLLLLFIALIAVISAADVAEIQYADCVVTPVGSAKISGVIEIAKASANDYKFAFNLQGESLTAVHSVFIHKWGDISSASSAGEVYNPDNTPALDCPTAAAYPAGSIGFVNATDTPNKVNSVLSLSKTQMSGANSIVGRALSIYSGYNCTDLPSAGTKIGQCVIGVGDYSKVAESSPVFPFVNVTGFPVSNNTANNELGSGTIALICKPVGTVNAAEPLGGTVFIKSATDSSDVTITAAITGINTAPTNPHGLHIHTWGDIRQNDAMAIGGHWKKNASQIHNLPPNNTREWGDLGNICTFHTDGNAYYRFTTNYFPTSGFANPIGRSIAVHKLRDEGDPAKLGGLRIGQCVLGLYDATATAPVSIPTGVTVPDIPICAPPAPNTTTTGDTSTTTGSASSVFVNFALIIASILARPDIAKYLTPYQKKLIREDEKKLTKKEARKKQIQLEKQNKLKGNKESKSRLQILEEKIHYYEQLDEALKPLIDDPREKYKNEILLLRTQKEREINNSMRYGEFDKNIEITNKELNILFGGDSDSVVNSMKTKSNPMERTVVEFYDIDGKPCIGVVLSIHNENFYTIQRLRLQNSDEEENDGIQSDVVTVSKMEVMYHWYNHFNSIYSMSIEDLINLESEYQKNSFKLNSEINSRIFNLLFNDKTRKRYQITSVSLSKLIYQTEKPTLLQVFSAFKYIASSPFFIKPPTKLNNKIDDGIKENQRQQQKGYLLVSKYSSIKEFTKKVNQFIKQKQSNNSSSKTSFIEMINSRDAYFLNILFNLSISPIDFLSNRTHQLVFNQLGLEPSPESAQNLLKELGFLVDQATGNQTLFTQEVIDQCQDILDHPERYPDPLENIRRTFDLTTIAIDPQNIICVDDAISIAPDDPNSDLLQIFVHTVDISRWIQPGGLLYKCAMLNAKTYYLPQGTFGMLPDFFVRQKSLKTSPVKTNTTDQTDNNENETKPPEIQPAHAITLMLNFSKKDYSLHSYNIFPTRIPKIVQLSQDEATLFIRDALKEPDNSKLSTGHLVLKRLYEFTQKRSQYRDSNLKDLYHYGRHKITFHQTKIHKNNPRKGRADIRFRKRNYNKANEIIDEILSTSDDAYTNFFQMNQLHGFYKLRGQINLSPVLPSQSFTAITSPMRNFSHLISQLQLCSMIQNQKPIFSWNDLSSFGYDLIETLQDKVAYKTESTKYYIFKLISDYIEKQKEEYYQPKKYPTLYGKVTAINKVTNTFSIHLPMFNYIGDAIISTEKTEKTKPLQTNIETNNDNNLNQNEDTELFKLGDYVSVSDNGREFYRIASETIKLSQEAELLKSIMENGIYNGIDHYALPFSVDYENNIYNTIERIVNDDLSNAIGSRMGI
eukprot:gene1354-1710_t